MNDIELKKVNIRNDKQELSKEDVFDVIKEVPLSLRSLQGMIQTVSAIPSYTPTKFSDQFNIYYLSGANAYFYIYDTNSKSWHSATLN